MTGERLQFLALVARIRRRLGRDRRQLVYRRPCPAPEIPARWEVVDRAGQGRPVDDLLRLAIDLDLRVPEILRKAAADTMGMDVT